MLADRVVVEIGHHSQIAGLLKREAPALLAARLGRLSCSGGGSRGQTGEAIFVHNDVFELCRGVEHALCELGADHGKLDIDPGQTLLARFVEVGAVTAEAVDGLLEEPRANAGERLRVRCPLVAFERRP